MKSDAQTLVGSCQPIGFTRLHADRYQHQIERITAGISDWRVDDSAALRRLLDRSMSLGLCYVRCRMTPADARQAARYFQWLLRDGRERQVCPGLAEFIADVLSESPSQPFVAQGIGHHGWIDPRLCLPSRPTRLPAEQVYIADAETSPAFDVLREHQISISDWVRAQPVLRSADTFFGTPDVRLVPLTNGRGNVKWSVCKRRTTRVRAKFAKARAEFTGWQKVLDAVGRDGVVIHANNSEFKLSIVPPLAFCLGDGEAFLFGEFHRGNTLADLVRCSQRNDRMRLLSMFREAVDWLAERGILWGSPNLRNAVVNSSDGVATLSLLDFECVEFGACCSTQRQRLDVLCFRGATEAPPSERSVLTHNRITSPKQLRDQDRTPWRTELNFARVVTMDPTLSAAQISAADNIKYLRTRIELFEMQSLASPASRDEGGGRSIASIEHAIREACDRRGFPKRVFYDLAVSVHTRGEPRGLHRVMRVLWEVYERCEWTLQEPVLFEAAPPAAPRNALVKAICVLWTGDALGDLESPLRHLEAWLQGPEDYPGDWWLRLPFELCLETSAIQIGTAAELMPVVVKGLLKKALRFLPSLQPSSAELLPSPDTEPGTFRIRCSGLAEGSQRSELCIALRHQLELFLELSGLVSRFEADCQRVPAVEVRAEP